MSAVTEEELEKELDHYSEWCTYESFENGYGETVYAIRGKNAYSEVSLILSAHEYYDIELVIPYDATGNNCDSETPWTSIFSYMFGHDGLNLAAIDVDIQDNDITIYYRRG